jgi:hypothetical protein
LFPETLTPSNSTASVTRFWQQQDQTLFISPTDINVNIFIDSCRC